MRERLLRLFAATPFRLHLSSGIQHTITHPEQAIVVGAYLEVSIPGSVAAGSFPTESVFVSLIHVVQIEILQLPTLSTLNGANGQQLN